MRISLFHYLADSASGKPVEDFVQDMRALRDQGFDTVWSPQFQWEHDALTTIAIALREVDGLTLGTAVQPIQNRHPMTMAQTALTLSAISGGRFQLGVGLSHARVSETRWGIPWDRPLRRLTEYLDGLLPLLGGDEADAVGEIYTTRGQVTVEGATPPPVWVAALGPKLLRVAAQRTAGTLTYMTGPRTLTDYVVPTVDAAAAEVDRRAEVVAMLPMCVTDDAAAAREVAATKYAMYGALPSYRAMLDREGAKGPEDVALIGNEEAVGARLDELQAAGVAEFSAHVFAASPDDKARTRAFLAARRAAG